MVEKNQAAVELGRLGGKARAERLSKAELSKIAMKGAKARKAKVPANRRKIIAQKAAMARWKKKKDSLNQDDTVVR